VRPCQKLRKLNEWNALMTTSIESLVAVEAKSVTSSRSGPGIVGKFALHFHGNVMGKLSKNVYSLLVVLSQRLTAVSLYHPLFYAEILLPLQGSVTLPKNSKDWSRSNEGLTDAMVTSIERVHHWIFDCVVAISPIILFVPSCPGRHLSATNMGRYIMALGSQRPAELFDVEVSVWTSILQLMDNPVLLDNAPTTWFSIASSDPTGSTFFGSQVIPSVPGLVSLSSVKEREDLGFTGKALENNIFIVSDNFGTLSIHDTSYRI
jgi:hypothetical protein